MANPFENSDGRYHALVNEEGQYSLWPDSVDIPEGWTVALEGKSRDECVSFVEGNWTDMRPKSLALAMGEN
ncbi:MbtH family protein [Streptomyces sp. NPDC096132]|uniref:MbtH family protein n=1 Tax=Streptomyces sp. NPDC096132 TaxID=3366075 RepID=UPI003829E071